MSDVKIPISSDTIVDIELQLIHLEAILKVKQDNEYYSESARSRYVEEIKMINSIRESIKEQRRQYWDDKVGGHLDKIKERITG
jgi:hypothetical protein